MSPPGWYSLGLGTLLLLGSALPCAAQPPFSTPRTVQVAVDPAQHRVLSATPVTSRHASLIDGYARLVSESTGLRLREQQHPSTREALRALCEGRADIMLLLGPLDDAPCANLTASPAYYRGQTLMASRLGPDTPAPFGSVGHRRVAVIQGGRYNSWLQAHYPHLQVIGMPDLHGALSAVETGIADVAIGLDVVMRPMVRRDYADSLALHNAPDDLPGQMHLVTRDEDRALLAQIQQAMDAITPTQHAQLLQQWAQVNYFGAPTLGALSRHFRWELLATGLGLLSLLAITGWLLRAQRHAQRNERRQARFIGLMSHEVRNAAQALVASVDLLSQSGLDQGQRQLVNAARAAGAGLRQLLGHALDYSRLAAGQFQPTPAWHDVHQLATDCLSVIRPAAEAKGLQLALQVVPLPWPPLWLDGDALRQILTNLLGNALKFTAHGRIEVRLALLPMNDATQLRLVVADTGIGIAAEQQADVFKPFSQAHDQHSRQLGGAGLGLSICHDVTQALGGQIRLCSEPGQGSAFEVTLPVRRHSDGDGPSGLPLSGHTLLLVEDHALNRAFATRQLKALGASVSACCDAASALRLQRAAPCAIVLLDCGLSDMSGYALAEALRAMEQQLSRPPARLVAISAAHSTAHQQRCRASGMDAVLCKPLDTDALLVALELSERPPVTAAPTPAATAVPADDPLWSHFLRALEDELQALKQALQRQQRTALAYHAHRLAGVLRMLGQPALAEIASDLHELELESVPDWSEAERLLGYLAPALAVLTSAAAGSAATAHAPGTRSTPDPCH